MPLKLTGIRSLQNKLERIAAELRYDADRVLREHPDRGEVADGLQMLVIKLEKLARDC